LKKTAIITGVAGNLGKAVTKRFIDEGYYVVGTILNKSVAAYFQKSSFEEETLDLLDEKNCQKFVDDVVEKQGEINVAVLTAGGFTMGNIDSTTVANMYKQYQLNFETAYNMARPIFIQMIKQNNGRIFLIGSRAGLETSNSKGTIAYSLSKSLIFRLAEIMNAESKGSDVVTSVIVPSTIDTPQNRKSMPEADFSRWVKPAQIADTILFYSSDKAAALREPLIKIYNKS
jgi:NAD(P)-dependent dehydrogenase (short-subunit alcohol dehydrogenase family)